MAQADHFILLDSVQFKKNEWQNRNRIKTAQGAQWLTVPGSYDFRRARPRPLFH
ncbi:MAG: WbqC family protein, partial [Candidatus Latescibacterota bacterium]|nr:WbqC family protein [Candidatus Latescibacterota bacterium]